MIQGSGPARTTCFAGQLAAAVGGDRPGRLAARQGGPRCGGAGRGQGRDQHEARRPAVALRRPGGWRCRLGWPQELGLVPRGHDAGDVVDDVLVLPRPAPARRSVVEVAPDEPDAALGEARRLGRRADQRGHLVPRGGAMRRSRWLPTKPVPPVTSAFTAAGRTAGRSCTRVKPIFASPAFIAGLSSRIQPASPQQMPVLGGLGPDPVVEHGVDALAAVLRAARRAAGCGSAGASRVLSAQRSVSDRRGACGPSGCVRSTWLRSGRASPKPIGLPSFSANGDEVGDDDRLELPRPGGRSRGRSWGRSPSSSPSTAL